jgi:hypothetical protein
MQRNTEVGLFTQSSYFNPINRSPVRVKGIDASPSKNIFTLRGLYTIKKRKWKETSLAYKTPPKD